MMTLDSAHMTRPMSPLSPGVNGVENVNTPGTPVLVEGQELKAGTSLVVENGEVRFALERPAAPERFETAREGL